MDYLDQIVEQARSHLIRITEAAPRQGERRGSVRRGNMTVGRFSGGLKPEVLAGLERHMKGLAGGITTHSIKDEEGGSVRFGFKGLKGIVSLTKVRSDIHVEFHLEETPEGWEATKAVQRVMFYMNQMKVRAKDHVGLTGEIGRFLKVVLKSA